MNSQQQLSQIQLLANRYQNYQEIFRSLDAITQQYKKLLDQYSLNFSDKLKTNFLKSKNQFQQQLKPVSNIQEYIKMKRQLVNNQHQECFCDQQNNIIFQNNQSPINISLNDKNNDTCKKKMEMEIETNSISRKSKSKNFNISNSCLEILHDLSEISIHDNNDNNQNFMPQEQLDQSYQKNAQSSQTNRASNLYQDSNFNSTNRVQTQISHGSEQEFNMQKINENQNMKNISLYENPQNFNQMYRNSDNNNNDQQVIIPQFQNISQQYPNENKEKIFVYNSQPKIIVESKMQVNNNKNNCQISNNSSSLFNDITNNKGNSNSSKSAINNNSSTSNNQQSQDENKLIQIANKQNVDNLNHITQASQNSSSYSNLIAAINLNSSKDLQNVQSSQSQSQSTQMNNVKKLSNQFERNIRSLKGNKGNNFQNNQANAILYDEIPNKINKIVQQFNINPSSSLQVNSDDHFHKIQNLCTNQSQNVNQLEKKLQHFESSSQEQQATPCFSFKKLQKQENKPNSSQQISSQQYSSQLNFLDDCTCSTKFENSIQYYKQFNNNNQQNSSQLYEVIPQFQHQYQEQIIKLSQTNKALQSQYSQEQEKYGQKNTNFPKISQQNQFTFQQLRQNDILIPNSTDKQTSIDPTIYQTHDQVNNAKTNHQQIFNNNFFCSQQNSLQFVNEIDPKIKRLLVEQYELSDVASDKLSDFSSPIKGYIDVLLQEKLEEQLNENEEYFLQTPKIPLRNINLFDEDNDVIFLPNENKGNKKIFHDSYSQQNQQLAQDSCVSFFNQNAQDSNSLNAINQNQKNIFFKAKANACQLAQNICNHVNSQSNCLGKTTNVFFSQDQNTANFQNIQFSSQYFQNINKNQQFEWMHDKNNTSKQTTFQSSQRQLLEDSADNLLDDHDLFCTNNDLHQQLNRNQQIQQSKKPHTKVKMIKKRIFMCNNKPIPDWANDTEAITKQIEKQYGMDAEKIFKGECKVNRLDLNLIFSTNKFIDSRASSPWPTASGSEQVSTPQSNKNTKQQIHKNEQLAKSAQIMTPIKSLLGSILNFSKSAFKSNFNQRLQEQCQ